MNSHIFLYCHIWDYAPAVLLVISACRSRIYYWEARIHTLYLKGNGSGKLSVSTLHSA
jgi:hypothetical protein